MCLFVRAKTLAFDKRHELDDPQPFDAKMNAAFVSAAMAQHNLVCRTTRHTRSIASPAKLALCRVFNCYR